MVGKGAAAPGYVGYGLGLLFTQSLAATKNFSLLGLFLVVLPLGGWGAAAPAIVAALYPHSPTGMVGRGGPLAIAAAPYP